eukprot:5958455-Prymnesium_polylepis.1
MSSRRLHFGHSHTTLNGSLLFAGLQHRLRPFSCAASGCAGGGCAGGCTVAAGCAAAARCGGCAGGCTVAAGCAAGRSLGSPAQRRVRSGGGGGRVEGTA